MPANLAMPQAKHRRGHSAIVNTSILSPAVPQFQAHVQDYDPVAQDEEPAEKPIQSSQAEIDFDEALHEQGCPRCAQRQKLTQRRLPWMFACAALGALCLWLIMTRQQAGKQMGTSAPAIPSPPETNSGADAKASELGTYEKGFWNDLAAIKPQLSLETVQFSGAPQFTDAGKGSVPPGDGKPAYVGTPSPELDAAWDSLVKDRYILLSEDEARAAWGPDYQKWWVNESGGYLAGIDMLHSLHCLNHLRQALDPEYYPRLTNPGTEWHHDHCVDHIRQMVMCHGDLTPIPSRYIKGIHQYYVDTNQKHTCRNFDAIRQFASERVNGSIAVPAGEKTHPD